MNLIEFLKSNKNTRKIFGEKELKIIDKQLLGIALTQSEKNRLSRDIRKKFVFIKESLNFLEEFDLKKGAIINGIIQETKETILKEGHKKIKKIILYGSTIENELTFKSDIDFAVEFFDIDLKEATLFRKLIMAKVNKMADIQVYNILPNKIKREIDIKGKVLYESKD